MLRRMQVLVWPLGLLLLVACSREAGGPPAPAGAFTVETSLGPVNVLEFRDDPGRTRDLRVHAVLPDGGHVVRSIRILVEDDPAIPEGIRVVHAVRDGEVERARLTRFERGDEALHTVIETPGERLALVAAVEGAGVRLRLRLEREGRETTWERRIEAAAAADPAAVAEVRESLASFYGRGPLASGPDVALLVAILESPDWARYLGGDPLVTPTVDAATRRRIQQVCVAAAVASKISCFISRFTPYGMIVCVPSTGISLACLAYNVVQATVDHDPKPCPCECRCSS